jgi:Tol biopolymer transport system component
VGSDGPAFSPPLTIATISGTDTIDDDPSLTADLTELYFNSQRTSATEQEDIWRSIRGASEPSWPPPESVDELNTEYRETGIAIAPDGLTIWFSSDRPESGGGLDIFVAARAERGAPWSPAERVAELSSEDDDLVSAVSASSLSVFLARRTGEADDYDLFMSDRASASAAWRPSVPIAELNTDAGESDAFLAGEELFFTRAEDLHVARRTAPTGAFSASVPLTDLNSSEDDRDPWVSADSQYMIFSSNRSGSYMLYEAWREPAP